MGRDDSSIGLAGRIEFLPIAEDDNVIKIIRIVWTKQMGGFRWQMKFDWRAKFLSGWAIIWGLVWWRAIQTVVHRNPARAVVVDGVRQR